jgi:hypothetical protein
MFNDGAGKPCTDTLGFTHTITVSGAWKIRLVDGANDETSPEPSAGDKLKLTIPQNGVTDVDSNGCVITFAPSAPVTVTSPYNDHTTFTVSSLTGLAVATSGVLCPLPALTTAGFTATYTFSSAVSDAS